MTRREKCLRRSMGIASFRPNLDPWWIDRNKDVEIERWKLKATVYKQRATVEKLKGGLRAHRESAAKSNQSN